jgi:hypothetical protein
MLMEVPPSQRDEEFDESYEALLSLGSVVGEARPRGTSPTVLNTMEKGKYTDWATAESDKRCPICLDDVRLLLIPPLLHASSLT